MKLSIGEGAVNMEPYGSVKMLSRQPRLRESARREPGEGALGACCAPKSRRDRRREAILDVAGVVFSEEGYEAASMSTIAARVGGSKGTLYNYFRSKAELFEAYIEDYCAQHAE